jgi:hypothetical protein
MSQNHTEHNCKEHLINGDCQICGSHHHAWVENGSGSGSGLVIRWCYHCHVYNSYYNDTGKDTFLNETPDFDNLSISWHDCDDFMGVDGVCLLCHPKIKVYEHKQSEIVEFAKNSEDYEIRSAAVRSLSDENLLIDVAKNGLYINTRFQAAKKLNDKNLIHDLSVEIVMNPKNSFLFRAEAINFLGGKDKELLKEIILKDEEINISKKALYKFIDLFGFFVFNDKIFLADVAKRGNGDDILIDIAKSKVAIYIRERAVEELKNTDKLLEIINGSSNDFLFEEQGYKIDPQLWSYSMGDNEYVKRVDLRDVARKRLNELSKENL